MDIPANTGCSADSATATITDNNCPTPRMDANTQVCSCTTPTSTGAECKNLLDASCGDQYADVVVNGFNYYYPEDGDNDCHFDSHYAPFRNEVGLGDWEGSKKYQDTSCQKAETQLCIMNSLFDVITTGYYPSRADACGKKFPPPYDLSEYCGNSASSLASNPIVILSAAMLAILSIKLW